MNEDRRNFITAGCAVVFTALSTLLPGKKAEGSPSVSGLAPPPPNQMSDEEWRRHRLGDEPLWTDIEGLERFVGRVIDFMPVLQGVSLYTSQDERIDRITIDVVADGNLIHEDFFEDSTEIRVDDDVRNLKPMFAVYELEGRIRCLICKLQERVFEEI